MSEILDVIEKIHSEYGDTAPITVTKNFLGLRWKSQSGWLWLDKSGSGWSVWIASGRTTHNPLGWGPAVCVEFRRDNRPGDVHKTAISVWPVRNKEEAETIRNQVASAILETAAALQPDK